MSAERNFGHNFIKSISWGAHIGMFHQTSEEIYKIFIPYLAAGLKANEGCVWVTAVSPPEETLKLLNERIPDLDIYVNKKQLTILSPDDVYLQEGRLDKVDNIVDKWINIYNGVLSSGYEGLRIGADISWLDRAEFERFFAYKRIFNQIVAENRIISLCAHDTGTCEISDIIVIKSAYPYAIVERGGVWKLIENVERTSIPGMTEQKRMMERAVALPSLEDEIKRQITLIRAERLQALREMIAGIAHNFNNILTGVLGYAELLRYKTNPADISLGLEKIEQSALKARDLIKSMIDFTRIRKEREFEFIDLKQIVQKSIALTRPRWETAHETNGISIKIEEQWKGDLFVYGDTLDLIEVVTNIVINSVEAMPEGGTITFIGEKKDDFACLSISDTGIGMTEDMQKRVFEPFFTSKAEVGHGMGLATAYGTIRRHDGEIEVQSKLGEGTTFTIKLPYTKGLAEESKIGTHSRM